MNATGGSTIHRTVQVWRQRGARDQAAGRWPSRVVGRPLFQAADPEIQNPRPNVSPTWGH